MSATEVHNASRDAAVGKADMKLEVQIIPVSDVDRSKQFYQRLGWRLDDDAPLDGLRIVQFTPPGSGTSVTFGTGLTTAAASTPARSGTARGSPAGSTPLRRHSHPQRT
jgi:catechol 2,3-dioxygenase-like lactoylglutathione lyase family enzyme